MRELSQDHQAMGHQSPEELAAEEGQATKADWRKKMSDHVAYALLVYTGLQIFATVKAMGNGASSILPYVALIILVAAIIPACRWFERRWTVMSDEEATDPAFATAFRRDTVMLWAMAIGLPLVLTGICKAIYAVV